MTLHTNTYYFSFYFRRHHSGLFVLECERA